MTFAYKLTEITAYAHRGLHNIDAAIIENSPKAITMAIEAGLGIEIDVQMSRDLVPMVFHDETLARLTDRRERLNFLSAEEISKIRYSAGGDTIISLQDCLSLIGGRVPLLIEVKSHWTGKAEMEHSVLDICSQYAGTQNSGSHCTSPLRIMSFDPSVIQRFQSLGCKFPLGMVTSQYPAKRWSGLSEADRVHGKVQFDCAKEMKVDFLAHDITDIDNEYMKALLKEHDLPLFSWTISSKCKMDIARQHGAIPIAEFNWPDKLAVTE